MKKYKFNMIILSALIVMFTMTGCSSLNDLLDKEEDDDPAASTAVESVSLDQTAISVELNKTETLVATVLPSGADQVVLWGSSDETIATVVDGVVTGLKAGTATIIAASAENTSKNISCQVTVIDYAEVEAVAFLSEEVKAVDMDGEQINVVLLKPSESKSLLAQVQPAEANPKLEWSSSKASVATVDQTGEVTVQMSREELITYISGLGENGGIDDTALITVASKSDETKKDQFYVMPYMVVADESVAEDYSIDEDRQLIRSYRPSDMNLVWESSDETVISISKVDDEYFATALKAGTATITLKVESDPTVTDTVTVTVKADVQEPADTTGDDPIVVNPGGEAAIQAAMIQAFQQALPQMKQMPAQFQAMPVEAEALAALTPEFKALMPANPTYAEYIAAMEAYIAQAN